MLHERLKLANALANILVCCQKVNQPWWPTRAVLCWIKMDRLTDEVKRHTDCECLLHCKQFK